MSGFVISNHIYNAYAVEGLAYRWGQASFTGGWEKQHTHKNMVTQLSATTNEHQGLAQKKSRYNKLSSF